MFTTILAERPKIILQEFINDNQCEFLPKRLLKDNERTVPDIFEYFDFFLDAEKTFDNLNWLFMFKIPEDMNIRENFIKWDKSIYTT